MPDPDTDHTGLRAERKAREKRRERTAWRVLWIMCALGVVYAIVAVIAFAMEVFNP